MIEPEQVQAPRARVALGRPVVVGPDQEPATRTLVGGVRQRTGRVHGAVAADKRSAALVRVRLTRVRTDRVLDAGAERQADRLHQFTPPTR